MDLGLRFKRISDLMKKKFNRELEKVGLTFSQHHVLLYLSQCENQETSLKDLEKAAGVAQSTMAGIVMRLEDKGYIEPFADEADRRIKKVRLSSAGKKICENAMRGFQEQNKVMCSDLTEQEQRQLEALLEKVYQSLKNDEGKEEQE